jgi:hypothetical protein
MKVYPPGSEERKVEQRQLAEVYSTVPGYNVDPEAETTPEDSAPLTYKELEEKVHALWDSGAKMEAMELVFGRPINAEDLTADLATVFMQPNADEAFGAMLLVKSIEDSESAQTGTPE